MNRIMMCAALLPALGFAMGAGGWITRGAVDDFATVHAGSEVTIDVLANDGVLGPGLQLLRITGTPARGTAVVDGQQVRYVAHDHAEPGVDRFMYMLRRANGHVAVGRVQVEVTASEPVTLTLSGIAPGQFDPTCEVAVVVGAQRFETCLDGSGEFEVEVTTRNRTSIAVLEATLTSPTQPTPTRYRSVMRSVPGLVELAEANGSGSELGAAAYGGLHLTSYTTVNHALLAASHGTAPFAGEPGLMGAELDLDAQRLHAYTMVFEALTRNRIVMPAGYSDAYAVVADAVAAQLLYEGLAGQPGELAELQEEVLDEWLVDLPSRHAPGSFVLGSHNGRPGTINVRRGEGQQVHLDSEGEGRVYGSSHSVEPTMQWEVLGKGRLMIDESSPRLVTFTAFLQCEQGSQQFEATEALWLLSVSKVIDGLAADVSLLRGRSELLNADQMPPGCSYPSASPLPSFTALQTFGPEHVLEFGAVAGLGRRAMRLPRIGPKASGMDRTATGIVDFAEGLVEAPGLLPGIDVASNGDRSVTVEMHADLPEGPQPIQMRLFRTRSDGRGGEQWLGYADSVGLGGLGIGGLVASDTDPALFLPPGSVSGTWLSAFSIQDDGRFFEDVSNLYFDFPEDTAPVGARYTTYLPGQVAAQAFGWQVNSAGHLAMRIYRSRVNGRIYPICPDDCFVIMERVWEPLFLSGGEGLTDRIYLIESISEGTAAGLQLVDRRVNYYEAAQWPVPQMPGIAPGPQSKRREY